jgi:3',5'-cyclic-AMP phosphodiesterase
MPIQLPPLSRRKFLGHLVASTAAAGFSPLALANAKQVDSNSWALLSDPHIAADMTATSRKVNMADSLKITVRDVLSLPNHPGGVLVAGDCAFASGQAGDYGTFRDLVEPLRQEDLAIHLALGNHDSRETFWQILREEGTAKHPVPDRQTALLRTKVVNWFILDSLETTNSTPGFLGKPQLDWLAEALDANRSKPALVVVHHNPGITGNMGLKDTMPLFEIIRPRRQVKAYIYGHTHTWRVEQEQSGMHLINLPAVGYSFQDGEPTGWVHAMLEPGGMNLTLRCIDPKHKAHGQTFALKWRTD